MRSILAILLLLPLTTAFDHTLIPGLYTLSKGSCPSPISIFQNSTTLPANAITLNNTLCNVSLNLTPTPANKTALTTFLSETPQIGSFLTTSQTLTCGNLSLHSITLFETSKQLTLPSVLMPSVRDGIVLDKDFVYLVTKKCVFQREKLEDDDIVQQILNTVTECLPGDALITTETGLKQVNKLSENEVVSTTEGLEPILTWTHRDHQTLTRFTQIHFQGSNTPLELTPGHYVFTDRGLLPAGAIRIGMVMKSDKEGLVVRAVGSVMKRGLFNPHTSTGDVFVGKDRVRVSCYTSAVEPVVAHALLVPVRGGWLVHGAWVSAFGRLVEQAVEGLRYSRIVHWLSV